MEFQIIIVMKFKGTQVHQKQIEAKLPFYITYIFFLWTYATTTKPSAATAGDKFQKNILRI